MERDRSARTPGFESPELQLLVRCAVTNPTADDAAAIRALVAGPVNMAAVLVAAYQQQVLPLLYHNLSTLCPEGMPPGLLAQLKGRFEQQRDKNLSLAQELIRFRDLLAAHNIDSVPLKGPAVAIGVYGDLSLRGFRDLDFLLHPEDIRRAKELLSGLGYRIMPEISGARERSFLRSECEWSMANPDNSACIEIHWAVRERCFAFPLQPAELWGRLSTIQITGQPVRTLSREDLLLVLSVHGAKHCWDRMKWICDINEILRADLGLNWDRILSTAHRLHAVRLVLVAVQLAAQLLGAPLPTEVLTLLRQHPSVAQVVRAILSRLIAPPADDIDALRRHLLYLRMREGILERIIYTVSQFTTATEQDWNEVPLPDWLFPCYGVIRPCRLAAGYTMAAWKVAEKQARVTLGGFGRNGRSVEERPT